ncbi:CUB domain-containing protein [Bacteroidota bacterium]
MKSKFYTRLTMVFATILMFTYIAISQTTISVQVLDPNDDAEESASDVGGETVGQVNTNSSDLELVFDSEVQYVGMIFKGVQIPVGSYITNAYVQFQVDAVMAGVTDTALTLEIYGAKVASFTGVFDDAIPFSVSSAPSTVAKVAWSPGPSVAAGDAGVNEQTSDISSIIQEIIGIDGWAAGNNIMIVVMWTGDVNQTKKINREMESSDGDAAGAPQLVVTFDEIPNTIEVLIADGADDAEEYINPAGSGFGGTDTGSSDLELGRDNTTADGRGAQAVGLRYILPVGQGAIISEAYLQFSADQISTGPLTLEIYAEAANNAAAFTEDSANVSSRAKTTAKVEWTPPDWETQHAVSDSQKTVDISPIIQEVVSRYGWDKGNAIVIVLTPTVVADTVGYRESGAFGDIDDLPPALHLTYVGGRQSAAVSFDSTNITCFGLADGEVTVTAKGGTQPYTYQWDDDLSTSSATVTGLSANKYYHVIVTDADFSSATDSVKLSQPDLLIAAITDSSNISGPGLSDGTATVTPGGGTSPYSYLWDDDLSTTDSTATGLSANKWYRVIVTDANSCTTMDSAILSVPDVLNAELTDSSNVSCNGLSDGSADVTVWGGTPPYSILWNDDAGSTTETITNLAPNRWYHVTVTDAGIQSVTDSVKLSEPDLLIAAITDSSNISGPGLSDGTATVTPGGGTSPYSYLWDDDLSTTDSTVIGLSANKFYHVTVTDANSCAAYDSVILTQPNILYAEITDSSNVSCNGLSDGSANVTVWEGTPPYSILWNDDAGSTTETITNLAPNRWYHVTVTDASVQTVIDSVEILEPQQLISLITDSSNVSCPGISDGSATVTPYDGTPPYTYLWDDDLNTSDSTITGLSANTWYQVIVSDANGCSKTDSVLIGSMDPLEIDMQNNVELCVGESTLLTAPEGYAEYEWSDGSSGTNEISVNSSGVYWVKVTAESGCTDTDTIIVTAKPNPVVQINVSSNPISQDENTILTASGANTYKWTPINKLDNPFSPAVTADPDTNTTYTVTGTGENGCKSSDQKRIFVYCFNCGNVELFDTEGTLNQGCSNNNYNNDANCSWLVYPSGSQYIYLKFSKFDIKVGDILKIYDGQDANADLIGTYDNNNRPPYLIEAGSKMFIQFISDQNGTGEGFEAYYWTDLTPPELIPGTGVTDNSYDKKLNIYPNPFNQSTTISFPNPSNESYRMVLTDLSGKVYRIVNDITTSDYVLQKGDLGNGLYFIELRGTENYRGKIVIE